MSEPLWFQNLAAYSFQMAVVAIVGSALPYLLRLRAPRIMLAYWQALLATCLALPVLQPWKIAFLARPLTGTDDVAIQISMGPVTHAPAGWRLATLILLALAAGVLARLMWLAIGSRRLQGYRRRARLMVKLPEAVREMTRAVPVPAGFYLSDEISVPATFGRIDPVILLPRRFLEMDEDFQRAIACHELLHVARSDWTWNMAEELILALFWFHPALWWLVNRIRLAREQVVDREVLRLTQAPKPYLQALVEIAQERISRRATPAPLFLGEGQLAQRISLMVKEVAMSKKRLVASMIAMAVALIFTGCLAAWAFPLRVAPPAPANADGTQATTSKVADGVKGGVPGGLVGEITGVPGGVIGGVVGGVAGGVGSATVHHVDVKQLKVAHKVIPRYPPLAKQARVQGVVTLNISVNGKGDVTDAEVVSGPDLLTQAALDAVKQWKYEPSPLLPASTTVEIHFTLLDKNEPEKSASPSGSAASSESTAELKPAHKVPPVYPPLAKMAGIQGNVILEVRVEKDGSVSDIKVVSGHPLLVKAAMDAVRQWRYEPGPNLPATTRVTISFTLADGKSSKEKSQISSATYVEPEETQAGDKVYAIGGDIKAPQPVSTPDPSYTDEARKAHLKGTAVFSIVVNEHGDVTEVKEVSKPLGRGLDESAQDTLHQWKFQPALREGRPVAVRMMVETTFRYY